MLKMILLVGPPGSGKSTLAKKYEAEGFVRISQDDMGKGGHQEAFMECVREGKNIVVDRMNFDVQQRRNYLYNDKYGYETEIIVIHESYETCLKRALNRAQNEGHPTIKDEKNARAALQTFFTKYERPTEGEANKLTFIYPEGPKSTVIYSDLDGTLCDVEHRRHHVRKPEGQKKDWVSFFKEIPNDPVNQPVLDVLKKFVSEYPIVFCSGRSTNEKGKTVEWLDKHVDFPYTIYMRDRHDSRQDSIVKEILLDFEILTRHSIYFCLDDRDQVVQMLRKRGQTVFQVADGDF